MNIIKPIRNTLKHLALAVALGAGLGAGSTQAAISFDAATTASFNGAHSSIAWSHTVGGGADAMLVVGVTTESNPDRTVTGVTFGAQTLTQVTGARAFNGTTTANASDLWYLPAPIPGTATITVTYSGSVVNSTVAGAVSLFGVVQGPPEAVMNYSAGNGSTYSAAITTSTYGSWLVDAVNNGTGNATLTPTSGQTKRWGVAVGNHTGGGSTIEVTPAGPTTDTWTSSGTSRRALSVAAFAPVTPPLPADAGTSTVTADPLSVPDDGATAATITVTIKDSGGTPTSGKSVTLTSDRGLETISPATGFTDDSGVATFTVKSTTLGAAVLTAHVANDSIDVTQQATVTFVNSSACDILTFGPGAVINQGAQTILWTVGVGTDPVTLRPTYTTSIHATGLPASGADPGFSGTPPTASYTITAQDGSTQKTYTVTIEFSPMPVWTGLTCWYDASDGVTANGSGQVTAWNDISGNGHHASPSGTPVLASNQLNSKPAVQFRGNYLNCAGTMFTKEQYLVVRSPRTTSWGGYGAFLGRASGRGSSYLLTPENTTMWNDQAAQAVSRNGTPVVKNQHANGNYIFDLAPINEYMLLKIVVNDNNTSAASYQIARADGMSCDMDIAEIIGYDTMLSAGDEAAVGSYLADKYAITSAYPLISVPVAPTALVAEPLLNAIRLSWTAAWSATSYNVYRGTTSGVYGPTPIGTATGTTLYTDNDPALIAGTNYYYVVKAVNSVGEGPASNEAFAAPTSGKVNQTITFGPLATKTYGNAPFDLTATATSLLAVSYASSDESVASVSGSTVTIHKAGTTTITASQDGDTTYNPAPLVSQDLTVVMADQTITFTLALSQVRGVNDAAFNDPATGGASGNPVTYSSSDELVATVDATTGLVTIVGVGTTQILADQAGLAEYYNAAPQVAQTLTVIPPLLPVTSGLACWYDAGQGITEDGSGVASWADSSTLGHLATRVSGAPTLVPNDVGGMPAVHLQSNNSILDCAGGMFTKEQYVVVRSSNATWSGAGSFLARKGTGNSGARSSSYNLYSAQTGFWDDHLPAAVSKNGTVVPSDRGTMPRGGFQLGTITDYMLLKITVNSQANAANLAQYPYMQIGQNDNLGSCDMYIAEIIGYDHALSSEDETAVGSYLADKYGLTTAYPELGPQARILTFGTNVTGSSAVIGPVVANAATIAWTVPYGTTPEQIAILAPEFTISAGATCPIGSGDTQDFTSPVDYTVTSSDELIVNTYTVTVTVAPPPILVGASGSGTLAFNALPPTSEWTTTSIAGVGATVGDLTGMDALVNTYAASGISSQLGTVTADPVGTTTVLGQWNSTDLRLTDRAGTTAATCFMAKLLNNSGAAINQMDISFTLYGSGADAELPGYVLYYSLTGATDSWQRIGIYDALGLVTASNIPLVSPWANGATLYVLWIDDNGDGVGDNWYGFDAVSFAQSTGGYGTWASANAGSGAPNEDFNNDGVQNGIAYFMGENGLATNPGVVDGKVRWKKTVSDAYTVKVSTNLIDWGDAPGGSVTEDVTGDGTYVVFTLPTTGPKLFVRLEVTIP